MRIRARSGLALMSATAALCVAVAVAVVPPRSTGSTCHPHRHRRTPWADCPQCHYGRDAYVCEEEWDLSLSDGNSHERLPVFRSALTAPSSMLECWSAAADDPLWQSYP